jgi:tRNA threonylcarbamoyladenosine biosynthesis protein TsaE
MRIVFENVFQDDIEKVVRAIIDWKPNPEVITLRGDLGAGKTTLIKKVVHALGSIDVASSPTFGLLNEYKTTAGKIIYHSDWYRMKNEGEIYDTGIAEILGEPNSIFIVEWPEIGAHTLKPYLSLNIEIRHQDVGRTYILED